MIVIKLQSGLGNQFFQYALGRNLALKYKTQLVLDIGRFATDNLRDFKLHHFNIKAAVVNDFQSLTLLFSEPALLLKARTGAFKDVNDKFWEMTPFDTIPDDAVLRGYWANDLYFKDIREALLKELTLKPGSETADYKAWKKKVTETQSVAIHIRRGDYLDSTNKHIFNLLGLEYYQKAIQQISEKVSSPVFYIFSDSVEWVQENFQFPSRYEVVSDNTLQDVHEISLMRYCKHNIIANSTFSWWGAWLNTNPDKIMIAPRVWYHKEEAQRAYERGEVLHCKEFVRM